MSEPTDQSSSPKLSMNELGGLGAEGGFEEEAATQPLRFSGFVSLLLGLCSWIGILTFGAMVIPFLAILVGLIALRPSRFGTPVGTLPAKIGICLAVAFGMSGYLVPYFKSQTLGSQAEQFALEYIDLVNAGYETLGIELMKEKRNRFSKEMPLNEYYDGNQTAMESLDNFKRNGGNGVILRYGPDAKWVLDRPPFVFRQYGIDRAHLVFRCNEDALIEFHMQYRVDPDDVGQWHIKRLEPYRERIVAESVL